MQDRAARLEGDSEPMVDGFSPMVASGYYFHDAGVDDLLMHVESHPTAQTCLSVEMGHAPVCDKGRYQLVDQQALKRLKRLKRQ